MMGELALQKQLQKAFLDLQQVVNQWETTLSESKCVIVSLANLGEQYQCCQLVDLRDVSLEMDVSDVKDRLILKIVSEINSKLKDLCLLVDILKEGHGKVKKQQETAMKVYRKYSTDLNMDHLTHSSALLPSMVDMIEWLTDAESCLFELYKRKKHLVDRFIRVEKLNMEDLVQHWSSDDKQVLQTIKDYLCHVSFFLQEKL